MSWAGEVRVHGRGHTLVGNSVLPHEATFEATGRNGAPDALVKFEFRDGRPECVEINVRARSGGRGIRTSDMELFNIDNLATNVLAELGSKIRSNEYNTAESVASWPPSLRDAWNVRGDVHDARKSRRGPTSRDELEQVARVYSEYIDDRPTDAVEKRLGYSSRRTAARRVEQARAAGLLPATTRGKRKA